MFLEWQHISMNQLESTDLGKSLGRLCWAAKGERNWAEATSQRSSFCSMKWWWRLLQEANIWVRCLLWTCASQWDCFWLGLSKLISSDPTLAPTIWLLLSSRSYAPCSMVVVVALKQLSQTLLQTAQATYFGNTACPEWLHHLVWVTLL